MNKCVALIISVIGLISSCFATTLVIPNNGDSVVGDLQSTRAKWKENFHIIGRRYDIGFEAMTLANPKNNPDAPSIFRKVTVPTQFILPPGPKEGIVINLPEMRLYYYVPNSNQVMIYPVGIGLIGWETPEGRLHVIEKIEHPTWVPPKSIIAEYAAKGIQLPNAVHPGPEDPLGDYAMRLSNRTYLIHGTNAPPSIGTRASSGCIRLFPEDIQALFSSVPLTTPVRIIDEPYVAGWKNGQIYLAAFPMLIEDMTNSQYTLDSMAYAVNKVLQEHGGSVTVNWLKAIAVSLEHNGIPQPISTS